MMEAYILVKISTQREVYARAPIMDFDLDSFAEWIKNIKPSVVFVGYNSHQKGIPIPEPTWEKTLGLMCSLKNAGIQVFPKLIQKVADFFV